MENKQLVSLSRQYSSTPVGFDQAFLSKEQHGNTSASPDLDPADFYLFVRLNSALKGRHFCVPTDTIKNATKELKRLSQNDFHGCFQHLYIRWQKYLVALGDYFERDVV